jgi:hypothetical protein
MPRTNIELAVRSLVAASRSDDEEKVRSARRAFWDLQGDDVVFLAAVTADEFSSALFLMEVFDTLADRDRRQSWLVIGLVGSWPESLVETIRRQGESDRGRVAVMSARDWLWSAADVALVHATCEPRRSQTLRSLEHGHALLATPIVAQGDLLHEPMTGITIEPFDASGWRRGMTRMVREAEVRREMGRQGENWLASRPSMDDVLAHWQSLLVEAAELGRGSARRARFEEASGVR